MVIIKMKEKSEDEQAKMFFFLKKKILSPFESYHF